MSTTTVTLTQEQEKEQEKTNGLAVTSTGARRGDGLRRWGVIRKPLLEAALNRQRHQPPPPPQQQQQQGLGSSEPHASEVVVGACTRLEAAQTQAQAQAADKRLVARLMAEKAAAEGLFLSVVTD